MKTTTCSSEIYYSAQCIETGPSLNGRKTKLQENLSSLLAEWRIKIIWEIKMLVDESATFISVNMYNGLQKELLQRHQSRSSARRCVIAVRSWVASCSPPSSPVAAAGALPSSPAVTSQRIRSTSSLNKKKRWNKKENSLDMRSVEYEEFIRRDKGSKQ